MMGVKVWQSAIYSSALLVIALGIASAVFSARAESRASSLSHSATYYHTIGTPVTGYEPLLETQPEHFLSGSLKSIEAAGIVSIFLTVMTLFFVITRYFNSPLHLLLGIVGIITPLVALAYSMAATYTSDRTWGYYDSGSSNGTYTVETWNCVMKTKFPTGDSYAETFASTCKPSQIARWLTIPLLFAVILFFALTNIGTRKMKPLMKPYVEEDYSMKNKKNNSASEQQTSA